MYLTIVGISIIQIVYIIISYTINEYVNDSDPIHGIIAIFVGGFLGAGQFIFQCIMPLRLAKEFTEKKMRRG